MLTCFEYENPVKVVFGKGVINNIGKSIKDIKMKSENGHSRLSFNKCFLVTGKSSAKKYGYTDKVIAQFDKLGIKHYLFNRISPNPKSNEVDEAAKIIREEKCDFVLALGGGSVMDATKGIAMLALNEGKIWEYVYKGPGKSFKKFNKALPIVMIPTFAATGSEVNMGAVISDPETKGKTPLFGESLYPKITIIDPELTYTVPYSATVDGVVDIICHVMEMYLSSSEDDYLQDQISIAIVKSVKRSLDILKNDLSNYEARAQMFWASSLALSGVATSGSTGDWPMHDIEHALSGHADSLSHGRGLAAIFLKILEYDKKNNGEKIVALSRAVFEEEVKDVDQAIQKWVAWFEFHETGRSLKEYIGSCDPEVLADQMLQFGGTPDFLPNIKPFYKENLIQFIEELA